MTDEELNANIEAVLKKLGKDIDAHYANDNEKMLSEKEHYDLVDELIQLKKLKSDS